MKKTAHQKELSITATQQSGGNTNTIADTIKVQSWLNLYANSNPASGAATAIDGDFGPSTKAAVINYQKATGQTRNGVVSPALFTKMCSPMQVAFNTPIAGTGLRELVVTAAQQHLVAGAFELTKPKLGSNCGPWVRAYMDGKEGKDWYWCMGFVQTILDQAASQLGKNFTTLMPLSYSCDQVGTYGTSKGYFISNIKIKANPALVKQGDIFLVKSDTSSKIWHHTGIVTAIGNGIFETIEGNTNTDGSNNGNGVYRRTRNFLKGGIDVLSISGLV